MTTKNPAPPASDPWIEFLRATKLVAIQFPSVHFEIRPVPPALAAAGQVQAQHTFREPVVAVVGAEPNPVLEVLIFFEIVGTHPAVEGNVIEMKLSARVVYVLPPTNQAIPATYIEHFGRQALHNAWPFLRQTAATLFSQAGVQAPLLPLLLGAPKFAPRHEDQPSQPG